MNDGVRVIAECEQLFVETVIEPWKEACARADSPWLATPWLRSQFAAMLSGSGDPVAEMVGFLGLARVANLKAKEYELVNSFYARSLERELHANLFLDLILTGASPPVALLNGYFKLVLAREEIPPPLFWHYLSRFIRHPFFGQSARNLFGSPDLPWALLEHLIGCNPDGDLDHRDTSGDNRWINAIAGFRSTSEQEKPQASDVLGFLGRLLRVDQTVKELTVIYQNVGLNECLLDTESGHPVQRFGRVPDYRTSQPSKEAIEYFDGAGIVASAWRYYNPLLRAPWNYEEACRNGVPYHVADFLSRAFFGMPVFWWDSSALRNFPDLAAQILSHPSAPLARFYSTLSVDAA